MKTTLFEVDGAFNKAYFRVGLRRKKNSKVSRHWNLPIKSPHIFSERFSGASNVAGRQQNSFCCIKVRL